MREGVTDKAKVGKVGSSMNLSSWGGVREHVGELGAGS